MGEQALNPPNRRVQINGVGHFCARHYRNPQKRRTVAAKALQTRCFACPYECAEKAAQECPDYEPASAAQE